MNDQKALKAGAWYTLSNFLVSGVTFLVTPVFARIMSSSDYGMFSTYNAWRSILLIIVTAQMAASINRARFDFKGDIKRYISSIAFASVIIPVILYCAFLIFFDTFFGVFQMEVEYIHLLFVSILFPHIVDIYMSYMRIQYRYKASVVISVTNTLLTVGLSVVLVLCLRDKLLGRILGQAIPVSVLGVIIFLFIMKEGRGISIKYIVYAIKVSLPFIPHLLAANILTQSDRIIITDLIGETENALYSIACTCSMLINILLTSINSAWTPWLGERINLRQYEQIKEKSKPCVLLFFVVYIGAILVSPELVLFFGGGKYKSAVFVMPPLITSTMFQFVYTQYVNIEQFEKKIWRVAVITVVSAGVNLVGNYVLIPRFGYVAAAYTTLAAYILMCVLNYISVRLMKKHLLYDNSFFGRVLLLALAICAVSLLLYRNDIVRYIFIGLYLIVVLCFGIKNKDLICRLIKKGKM